MLNFLHLWEMIGKVSTEGTEMCFNIFVGCRNSLSPACEIVLHECHKLWVSVHIATFVESGRRCWRACAGLDALSVHASRCHLMDSLARDVA